MADPEALGIQISNIVLGLLVLFCFAVVAVSVIREAASRIRHSATRHPRGGISAL